MPSRGARLTTSESHSCFLVAVLVLSFLAFALALVPHGADLHGGCLVGVGRTVDTAVPSLRAKHVGQDCAPRQLVVREDAFLKPKAHADVLRRVLVEDRALDGAGERLCCARLPSSYVVLPR